jgi:phosphatidate cytidylyltransferase
MKDWKRYVTGLLLIPVVIAVIYLLPETPFIWLMMIFAYLAYSEFLSIFKLKKDHIFAVSSVLMLLMIDGMSNLGALRDIDEASVNQISVMLPGLRQFFATMIGAVVLIPVFSLLGSDNIEEKFRKMTLFLAGFFYLGIPFGLFSLVRFSDSGYHWLTFAFVIPWICDSGAYYGGRFFGKHKFAPVISPNKTWEGAISGAVTSVIAGVVFAFTLLKEEEMLFVVAVALFIGILGQAGDLVESLIKRSAGVKDSGKLFPGHGGILDRSDSVIISVAVVFIGFLIRSYVL